MGIVQRIRDSLFTPAQAAPLTKEGKAGLIKPVDASSIYVFDGTNVNRIDLNKLNSSSSFTGMLPTVLQFQRTRYGQDDESYATASAINPYVMNAVNQLSSDIVDIKYGVRNSQNVDIENHLFMRALVDNRRLRQQDAIKYLVRSLLIFGKAYMRPLSHVMGGYTGIQMLNPIAVDPVIQSGRLVQFEYFGDGGMEKYLPGQLLYYRLENMLDDHRGLSPMSSIMNALNIYREVDRYTLDQLARDLKLSGILTAREGASVSQQSLDTALEQIKKNLGSRFIALSGQLEFTTTQQQYDTSTLELSDHLKKQIAVGFRIPLSIAGSWDTATYQTAPEQRRFYLESVVSRYCDEIATWLNDVVIPLFGGGEFYFDIDAALRPLEDQQAKSTMYTAQYKDGVITLNHSRELLGYEPLPGGDVLLIEGKLSPVSELAEPKPKNVEIYGYHIDAGVVDNNEIRETLGLAARPVDPTADLRLLQQRLTIMQLATAVGIPPQQAATLVGMAPEVSAALSDQPATAPTTQAPLIEAPKGLGDSDDEFWVGLRFPGNVDLVVEQSKLKGLFTDQKVEWTSPDEFHLSLLYAPFATPEQVALFREAIEGEDFEKVSLKLGTVSTFDDSSGRYPIHFRIRSNAGLKDLQAALYDMAVSCGIVFPSYSQPSFYSPHITLGYGDTRIRMKPYTSKYRVNPTDLRAEYKREGVYTFSFIEAQDAPVTVSDNPAQVPNGAGLESAGKSSPEWKEAATKFYQPYAPLKELQAWRKKIKNRGLSSVEFICHQVAEEVAEAIRIKLKDADSPAVIEGVFTDAISTLVKAIQATRIDFEDALADLLLEITGGGINKRRARTAFMNLIQVYGNKAARDGFEDSGVSEEPDAEEQAAIDNAIRSQRVYVNALLDTLYSDEDTISAAMREQKPAMWFNKSIYPIYILAMGLADENGMYEWVYGDTEHCDDCKRLNGQRHRMKDWTRRNLIPKSDDLECKGFNCKCNLVRTKKRASGSY